ncbi:MAG: hypothetical protein HY815_32390 [Candidatus Riflebacteria bacterium]|nr:hypothetical protein [Candidatus Riflebacteria bacterium]
MAAFSGRTGTLLWSRAVDQWTYGPLTLGAVDGDDVPDALIPTADGYLMAFSGRTGDLLGWTALGAPSSVGARVIDTTLSPRPFIANVGTGPIRRGKPSEKAQLLRAYGVDTVVMSYASGILWGR